MDKKIRDTAKKLFNSEYEQLSQQEKHVAHHITTRTPISTNITQDYSEQSIFGQKMVDVVASFGGSWTFIIIFTVMMFTWIILNSIILIQLNNRSFHIHTSF